MPIDVSKKITQFTPTS